MYRKGMGILYKKKENEYSHFRLRLILFLSLDIKYSDRTIFLFSRFSWGEIKIMYVKLSFSIYITSIPQFYKIFLGML